MLSFITWLTDLSILQPFIAWKSLLIQSLYIIDSSWFPATVCLPAFLRIHCLIPRMFLLAFPFLILPSIVGLLIFYLWFAFFFLFLTFYFVYSRFCFVLVCFGFVFFAIYSFIIFIFHQFFCFWDLSKSLPIYYPPSHSSSLVPFSLLSSLPLLSPLPPTHLLSILRFPPFNLSPYFSHSLHIFLLVFLSISPHIFLFHPISLIFSLATFPPLSFPLASTSLFIFLFSLSPLSLSMVSFS